MSPLWLGPPFRRYGEALNPGPKLFTTVQTINVSSLWDTIDLLGKEEPAYTMIQEHCAPPAEDQCCLLRPWPDGQVCLARAPGPGAGQAVRGRRHRIQEAQALLQATHPYQGHGRGQNHR